MLSRDKLTITPMPTQIELDAKCDQQLTIMSTADSTSRPNEVQRIGFSK